VTQTHGREGWFQSCILTRFVPEPPLARSKNAIALPS
jgi:hypothetical protein